jgi:hydroxymethylbilane synthase
MAGLARLGVRAAHIVPFPVERVVPAVGQGALAVEVRAGAQSLCNILYAAVNDPMSELCVECERAALREMRAGCSAPIGIHAILMGSAIVVHGAYASDHGMARARLERSVSTMEEARALGIELAGALR